ncbi:hypothetical protein ZIOFF_062725 [Zingiber officinale]|uniref:ABC transporter domain-containing protein n=1 Tax=Zingiber officinale TaxID=94328 RepID=A0A8J5KJH8_ZINOF|nr:hypothetical protein ZIOFF_062725 [Zingiber officinale]
MPETPWGHYDRAIRPLTTSPTTLATREGFQRELGDDGVLIDEFRLTNVCWVYAMKFEIVMRIVTISSWGSSLSSISGVAVMYGLSLDILLLSVIWNFCRDIRGEDTAVHHIQWTTSLNNIEQTRYQLAIPWRNKTAWTTGDTNLSREFYTINNYSDDSMMVHVRYGESIPFMLRGLTYTFLGELKTGIVGRTGRGKSTLMQALFRVIDPTVGRIVIEGIDI